MRIDSNQGTQAPAESDRTASQRAASAGATSAETTSADPRASSSGVLGEDQAQLSGAYTQVQVLAAQALQFPEVRQEKVNALRQVVLNGSYRPSSNQVAEAVFTHMLVAPAA